MNRIKKEIKKEIGYGPLIISVLLIFKVLGFTILPITLISYVLIILIAVCNLKNGTRFDKLTGIFLLYIPISLLVVNGPDPIFKSWERFVLFIVLMLAVSPLIKDQKAVDLRLRLFKGTMLCCVAIGIISFVCYFIGINYMRSTWDGSELDYLSSAGGTFGGITAHSMLLGPISGAGVISSLYLANKYRNKKFWVGAIMCMGAILFAASRASLIATIGGACIYFLFSRKGFGKNVKRITTIAAVLALTFPLWNSALSGIEAKNQTSVADGINMGSRMGKWEIRINEWTDNPIFGIGFCSVSQEDTIGIGGIIEPGSSWLAVLSMTGIIGFVLFALIYFRACKNILKNHRVNGAFIGAVLILFGIHMMAEGYIYSAGSFLCYLTWLTIGTATWYKEQNK